MKAALDQLFSDAEMAVHAGDNIIILSDRMIGPDRVAIPALLATAGVHHHLIRKGLRTSVGLVVETGEAREIHHFCALAGYGAEAINPYLAFETLLAMKPTTSPRKSTSTRSSIATSRRSVRASSRSPPRWASRPISPIAARRSSTPSASRSDFVEHLLHRHRDHHRGRRPRRDRRPRRCKRHHDAFGNSPGARGQSRRRRRLRLPPARRSPCLALRDRRQPAARRARQLPATSTASSPGS